MDIEEHIIFILLIKAELNIPQYSDTESLPGYFVPDGFQLILAKVKIIGYGNH
ncbi:Uncharacterised protein [Yersinia pekkanenii]|uniref:Uncharacterized protein n=1 Tax=Yersinia pekkanenii TaxID=1288385 RepID=A0ABP2A3I9_9GAMM|nr:Uncharacterised protein [Yersinia pekkanenii]